MRPTVPAVVDLDLLFADVAFPMDQLGLWSSIKESRWVHLASLQ